ncbi:MAG TPA: universal stress protein [Myxococcales bacterium]|nr:universal stress protein [Myxococcales bacterium]
MWKSIVCGVDSRPGCAASLRLAARLAREQSATLILVHAEEAAGEAPFAPPLSRAPPRHQVEETRWAALASDLRGEPVRLETLTGDPADAIVEFARKSGCDLIVVGSHAHSRATLALTSVVGKLLAHAPCPVIVVPSGMEDWRSDFPGQVA